MNKYCNAYREVYTILDCLDEEEKSKIPQEVLEAISSNMNIEYEYELDDDIELRKQPMLPETKAILFNLFRDYLGTPEQKEKILRMQQEERLKKEQKKKELYNADVFEGRKEQKTKQQKEKLELIEYKESLFKRIINKIKRMFKRQKD